MSDYSTFHLPLLFIIKKQFFAGVNLKKFNWGDTLDICANNSELQQLVLNSTTLHPLNQVYPVRRSYQKAFLKHIIDHLEHQNAEISDKIYEQYVSYVNGEENKVIHLHFFGENSQVIASVAESLCFISNGTTGLSTWPAARVLAEYCLRNQKLLLKKSILELGCGTGLLGIAALQTCSPNKYIFSDCHPNVLAFVTSNLKLSSRITEETEIADDSVTSYKDSAVQILNLPWEEISIEILRTLSVDVILAADVIYDADSVEPLVQALYRASSLGPVLILIACAVRNLETFDTFLKKVNKFGGKVNEKTLPECMETFFPDTDVPLKIFEVNFDEKSDLT